MTTSRARAWRALLLAWLTAVLAACGPGVGGTGTGNGAEPPGISGLVYFGADAVPVCATNFGGLLGCEVSTGDPVPPPPTPVTLTGDCGVATFDGNDVTLDILCLGWTFAGTWGVGPDGSQRYYGLMARDLLLSPSEPATLEVQRQGDALVVWLRGVDGQLLAGPLGLSR